jgi:hypothetical protein
MKHFCIIISFLTIISFSLKVMTSEVKHDKGKWSHDNQMVVDYHADSRFRKGDYKFLP